MLSINESSAIASKVTLSRINYHELAAQACKEKTFQNVLTPKLRQEKKVYEKFREVILNFFPEKHKILSDLKYHLTFMNLEEAKELLHQHPHDKHRKLIEIADRVMAQSYTFHNEDDAKFFFDERQKAYQAKISKGEECYYQKPKRSSDIIKEAKNIYGVTFDLCYRDKLKSEWSRNELSFKHLGADRLNNLIKNSDKHPKLKKYVEVAKAKIEIYVDNLKQVLTLSNRETIKPEFQEVIFGPTALLFDRYGLMVRDWKNIKAEIELELMYPFFHEAANTGGGFGYTFKNPSIAEFENEIRHDLKKNAPGIQLPPPIFSNKTTTVLSQEEQEVKKNLEKDLSNWLELSEQGKECVLLKLLEISGWIKLGLSASELEMTPFSKGSDIVKLFINKKGNHIPVTFHLDNLSFSLDLLDGGGSLFTDTRASTCILEIILQQPDGSYEEARKKVAEERGNEEVKV